MQLNFSINQGLHKELLDKNAIFDDAPPFLFVIAIKTVIEKLEILTGFWGHSTASNQLQDENNNNSLSLLR